MILSISKIKDIQHELGDNRRNWSPSDFETNDLCETALHFLGNLAKADELNRALLEGQERLQATNAKLESTIRESTKTINRLALENSRLKEEREILRKNEKRSLEQKIEKLMGKRCLISEKADWSTETR